MLTVEKDSRPEQFGRDHTTRFYSQVGLLRNVVFDRPVIIKRILRGNEIIASSIDKDIAPRDTHVSEGEVEEWLPPRNYRLSASIVLTVQTDRPCKVTIHLDL